MRDIQTSKVIFSVYQGIDKETDVKKTRLVFETLRDAGIQFRMVQGLYKGVPEEGFLLYTHDTKQHTKHLSIGIELGRHYRQESVLEVGNDNTATLHLLSTSYGTVESAGTWREVSQAEALSRDNFTLDVLSGRYFIAE